MPSVSVEALITDRAGRVLILKPLRNASWTLVGGEAGEEERPDCALGDQILRNTALTLAVGRMLSVDWEAPARKRAKAAIHIVFECGNIEADAMIKLPMDEFGTYRFVGPSEAIDLLSDGAGARLQSALRARSFGGSVYLPSLSKSARLSGHHPLPAAAARDLRLEVGVDGRLDRVEPAPKVLVVGLGQRPHGGAAAAQGFWSHCCHPSAARAARPSSDSLVASPPQRSSHFIASKASSFAISSACRWSDSVGAPIPLSSLSVSRWLRSVLSRVRTGPTFPGSIIPGLRRLPGRRSWR